MKNIEALCRLYRELVKEGARDLPDTLPLEGHYFCPLPEPSPLWASIRFKCLQGDERRRSAAIVLYVPSAGTGHHDIHYLEIQAFDGLNGGRVEPFLRERMPGRDPFILDQCRVILEKFKEIIRT